MKIIASFPICYLSTAPISWEYLTGENVKCLLPSLLEQTLVKSRDCVDSEAWHLTVCVWHMSPVSPWITYLPVKGLHCQPSRIKPRSPTLQAEILYHLSHQVSTSVPSTLLHIYSYICVCVVYFILYYILYILYIQHTHI